MLFLVLFTANVFISLCFFFVLFLVLFFVLVFISLCFFFVLFLVLFTANVFTSLCFFFVLLCFSFSSESRKTVKFISNVFLVSLLSLCLPGTGLQSLGQNWTACRQGAAGTSLHFVPAKPNMHI